MSKQYRHGDTVPTEVLVKRLNEFKDAVVERLCGNPSLFESEFTCRIPAELDRDPDLVFSEAAIRLQAQQSTIKELEEKLKGLEGAYSNINKDYQEILYQVQSKVPDQTRHERAVSIINAHENQENPPALTQLDE